MELIVRATFGNGHALRVAIGRQRHGVLKRLLIALHAAFQHAQASSIAWNARFDGEPCFPHGELGIFISGGASIGRNCVIFQQVTIGSNTVAGSRGFGAPTIGDDCYIGAGAKVIGNVKIGHRVRIAANAVVMKDVASDCVVTHGTQEVRQTTRLDNRFYTWHQGGWAYFDSGAFKPVTDPAVLEGLRPGHQPPAERV
ncbi:serine acetyltransferase [Ideonella sp. BN130291]|uniref:serine acetyltransferase n=1 Tax=Ideonella sp. BN130291 TaxID=3112940 RepID=UPI002E25B637|nr:serine acetyltransferase [Ideonella sp. BN130291]